AVAAAPTSMSVIGTSSVSGVASLRILRRAAAPGIGGDPRLEPEDFGGSKDEGRAAAGSPFVSRCSKLAAALGAERRSFSPGPRRIGARRMTGIGPPARVLRSLRRWFTRSVHSDEALTSAPRADPYPTARKRRWAAARFPSP